MQRSQVMLVGAVGVTLVLVGACASSRPRAGNSAVRRFQAVDQRVVFDTAAAVLSDMGYIVDRQDGAAGLLTTRPILDLPEDQGTPRALRLSSKGRTRRIVKVRVAQTTETVSVFCRVLVQEQTTQAHRLLAEDYRGSDTPTTTPIERDAATTREQNTVWQTIRRDKPAERRILGAIAERTKPTPAADQS